MADLSEEFGPPAFLVRKSAHVPRCYHVLEWCVLMFLTACCLNLLTLVPQGPSTSCMPPPPRIARCLTLRYRVLFLLNVLHMTFTLTSVNTFNISDVYLSDGNSRSSVSSVASLPSSPTRALLLLFPLSLVPS